MSGDEILECTIASPALHRALPRRQPTHLLQPVLQNADLLVDHHLVFLRGVDATHVRALSHHRMNDDTSLHRRGLPTEGPSGRWGRTHLLNQLGLHRLDLFCQLVDVPPFNVQLAGVLLNCHAKLKIYHRHIGHACDKGGVAWRHSHGAPTASHTFSRQTSDRLIGQRAPLGEPRLRLQLFLQHLAIRQRQPPRDNQRQRRSRTRPLQCSDANVQAPTAPHCPAETSRWLPSACG